MLHGETTSSTSTSASAALRVSRVVLLYPRVSEEGEASFEPSSSAQHLPT